MPIATMRPASASKKRKKPGQSWPTVPGETRDALLAMLRTRVVRHLRPERNFDDDGSGAAGAGDAGDAGDAAASGAPAPKRHKRANVPWLAGREELAIGVNEATRALEADKLQLLLVCRDARPLTLVQHLPDMAKRLGVPFMVLPNASTGLGEALGLKRCMAFGIKKQPEVKPAPKAAAGAAGGEAGEREPAAAAAETGTETAAAVAGTELTPERAKIAKILSSFSAAVLQLPRGAL